MGNAIGAGDLRLAKAIATISVLEGSSLGLLMTILVFTFSDQIALLYFNDAEMIEELSNTLQAMSLCIILFACISSTNGTMKAVQMQRIASIIIGLTLFAVSLPMA